MPEIGTCCYLCEATLPDAVFDNTLVELLHTYLKAQAPKPTSRRIPISLDESLNHSELKKDATARTPFGVSWGSRNHNLYDATSCWRTSCPNANSAEGDTHLPVDVLTKVLQQAGIDQTKSNAVIQSVKIHLDHEVHESSTYGADMVGVNKTDTRKEANASARGKVLGGKTMMICNIPCRVLQADLVEAIESLGFEGKFEFVHIPCRYGQSHTNLGYAFIHFSQMADADSFAQTFEGYRFFSRTGSAKACTVKVAACQGSIGSHRRMSRNLRLSQQVF
jgi:hypothetical protein